LDSDLTMPVPQTQDLQAPKATELTSTPFPATADGANMSTDLEATSAEPVILPIPKPAIAPSASKLGTEHIQNPIPATPNMPIAVSAPVSAVLDISSGQLVGAQAQGSFLRPGASTTPR